MLGALGIVWALNLFNFMDGIDGLAASEAMFMSLGAGALLTAGLAVRAAVWPALALTFAAACGGFLLWNWPPANIFLGDVGSGYLGYMIAVLALAATQRNPVASVGVADPRRRVLCRRHRHAGAQNAARGAGLTRRTAVMPTSGWRAVGEAIARVTGAVLVVNLLWLLPWAVVARRHPPLAVPRC